MKKLHSVVFLSFFLIAGSVISIRADIEGEWVNVDPNTRGITRLMITRSNSRWSIAAWGKCHPRDCVWGSTILEPLGGTVEDFSFEQGFAMWNAGFATKYITVSIDSSRLMAQTVTIFRDRSRRANVRSIDVFQRSENSY